MNLRNIPTTNSIKISAAVAACLAFSACGAIAEKVTEEGAERILESETGENVDIDFDSGDGSFSVQTEDGSFSVNEDGSFVVTGENGEVLSGNANDDGLIVVDENGDPVLNVSGDGANGEISIQGDDGEGVFRVVTDIPDEWPRDVPRPDGLDIEGGSYVSSEGEVLMTIIGSSSGNAVEYTDDYLAAVAAAGFTETGRFDQSADGSTTAQRTYENAAWTLSINGFVDGDTNIVNISLVSKT